MLVTLKFLEATLSLHMLWIKVQEECPMTATEALKSPLLIPESDLWEVGYAAMWQPE